MNANILIMDEIGTDNEAEGPAGPNDFRLDEERLTATAGGQAIELTRTEFAILKILVESAGQALTRVEILDAINTDLYAVTPRSIDVHIARLRQKLGDYGKLIEVVRKVGYRFRA